MTIENIRKQRLSPVHQNSVNMLIWCGENMGKQGLNSIRINFGHRNLGFAPKASEISDFPNPYWTQSICSAYPPIISLMVQLFNRPLMRTNSCKPKFASSSRRFWHNGLQDQSQTLGNFGFRQKARVSGEHLWGLAIGNWSVKVCVRVSVCVCANGVDKWWQMIRIAKNRSKDR